MIQEERYLRIVQERKRGANRRTLLGFLLLALMWAAIAEWNSGRQSFSILSFVLQVPYRAAIIVILWFGGWVALYSAARMFSIYRLLGDWRQFVGAWRVMLRVRMFMDGAVSLRFTFGLVLIVTILAALAYWCFPIDLLLAVVVCAGLWLVPVASMATPPAVLLMSTSTKDSIALQSVLSELIFPLGVFSLLRLDQADKQATALVGTHCVRVHDDADWLAVIRVLVGIVPYAVLDTRSITSPVEHEVEHVLTNDLSYKVIFVTNDEHACPAVDSVLARTGGAMPENLCMVNEWRLCTALPALSKARLLPSHSSPIRTLIVAKIAADILKTRLPSDIPVSPGARQQ